MKLENPLMNAAGTVKLLEQAEKLAKAPLSAIVLGSYTTEARTGNEGTVYHRDHRFTLNALGLPNPGIDYYVAHRREFSHACNNQLIIVSVAGENPIEIEELVRKAASRSDAVEINLGCPNRWLASGQAGIASFSLPFITRVLRRMRHMKGIAMGLKLSPYSDPQQLKRVAHLIREYDDVVSFVTLSNTFPNGWYPDALSTPYGGVSGAGMLPIVLGQIKQFNPILGDKVQIFAAGGIRNATDVCASLRAGADGVQVGSRYLDSDENPGVFSDLLQDYYNLFGDL